MKRITRKNRIFLKNFSKLLILLLIILAVAVSSIYLLSVHALEQEVETMNQNTTSEFQHRTEDMLEQCNLLTTYLAVDSNVQFFFQTAQPQALIERYYAELREKLRAYTYGISYVDSIILYSTQFDRVFTESLTRSYTITEISQDRTMLWDINWLDQVHPVARTETTAFTRTGANGWPYYITLMKHFHSGSIDGAVLININLSKMYDYLIDSRNNSGSFFIVDNQQNVILQANKNALYMPTSAFPELGSYAAEKSFCSLITNTDAPYAYAQVASDFYDFTYVSTTPIGDFMTRIVQVQQRFLIISIIVVLIALGAAGIYSLLAIRPLQSIQKLLDNPTVWQQHNETPDEEIQDIADQIIGHLQVNDLLRKELDTRLNLLNRTQIQALQAQMNPHFLFNTLNIISLMIESDCGEDHPAARMTSELADILRYSLSKSDRVPIRLEMTYAQKYMSILQARYEGFYPTLDIAPELLDFSIPKLSLQPLIENALQHGLSASLSERDGYLTITGRQQLHTYENGQTCQSVCIEVRDNGIGMDADKLEELRELVADHGDIATEHIGLPNVARRFYLLFHAEQSLTIDSTPGQGTVIRLIFREL